MSDRTAGAVMGEDLEVQLNALLDRMAEVGRTADAISERKGLDRADRTSRDFRGDVFDSLKDALEDELPVAPRLVADTEISPREQDREIAKRALAAIKLPQLKVIAGNDGLAKGGTRDDLLDRIVRYYHADRQAIAELVLRYEPEPTPDLRHSSRLFPTDRPIEPEVAGARMTEYVGRYLRTGIAQWFLINNVQATDAVARMRGVFRAYTVDVAETEPNVVTAEPEQAQHYTLDPRRSDADAELILSSGALHLVEVKAKGPRESRAAARAFEFATGIPRRERLPIGGTAFAGDLATWNRQTVWIVDFLNTVFNGEALAIQDLTSAGFEMGTPDRERSERTPQVKSVQFHGQHIFDSRPACELIVAGEQLSRVAILARFSPTRDESYLLPMRLTMERDHIHVVTGFGTHPPEIAGALHRQFVAALAKQLETGVRDVAAMTRFAKRVEERAADDESGEADLFAVGDDGVSDDD